MKSKMKRFLMLLITLVLLTSVLGTVVFADEPDNQTMPRCYLIGDVTGDGNADNTDAFLVLKHSIWPDKYKFEIDQDWNFNGDGYRDSRDAVYIFKAFQEKLTPLDFADVEPMTKMVHAYYDEPTWSWIEIKDEQGNVTGYAAKATFKCYCDDGENTNHGTYTVDATVASETVAPTCVAKGKTTYTATCKDSGGKEYTDTKVVEIPASGENGHTASGEATCEAGVVCTECGAQLQAALGHDFVIDELNSKAGTCANPEVVEAFKCSRCPETKTETKQLTADEQAKLHKFEYDRTEQSGCTNTKVLRCQNNGCTEEKAGESYTVHTEVSVLTPATCVTEGAKHYNCSVCGAQDIKEMEVVPCNEDHDWLEGATENGVTTHNCQREGCGATKTTVAVAQNQAISPDLANNQLKLAESDATVKMDAALIGSLEQNIIVDVGTVDKNTLSGVNSDLLGMIQGEVYDFTLKYADETDVPTNEDGTFLGDITITLPYTLQEGDDVENIYVWYITDEGDLTYILGTYNNGFVTFTTNHFSYYSVTRLTNEQRCEKFGHVMVDDIKEATCTEAGYYTRSCKRCGKVENAAGEDPRYGAALGHSYGEPVVVSATCENDGSKTYTCGRCQHVHTEVIPAVQHNYVFIADKSVEASHNAAGRNVYACSYCGNESVEELSQLAHNWAREEKAATCTEGGYVQDVCVDGEDCSGCGAVNVISRTAPMGHSYTAEWTWSEDLHKATAKLTCGAENCGHTMELNAVVTTVKGNTEATCVSGGTINYIARIKYNNQEFSDTQTVTTALADHIPGTELQHTATQHYYVCSVCETKLKAVDHVWGEDAVTKPATCVMTGKATQTCTDCGYQQEKTLPATGEHTYVDGVCECGQRENECSHVRMYTTPYDLSAYDICDGVELNWISCDCGEIKYLAFDKLTCDMVSEYKEEQLEDGTFRATSTLTCIDCGLKVIDVRRNVVDKEACVERYENKCQIFYKNELVAESTCIDPNFVIEHPYHTIEDGIDLSQYGLCKSGITNMGCHCGKYGMFWDMTGGGCRFEYDESRSTEDIAYYVCSVCDGEKTVEYRTEEDGCTINYYNRHTFYVDGVEVYALDGGHCETLHNYQITEYELYGDSCEDGIWAKQVCEKCGDSYEEYGTYHMSVQWETTDLTDYGFCATSMSTHSCPCEEQVKNTYFVYGENGSHSLWYRGQEVSEDGMVITTYHECENCGYMVTTVTTYSNPDEHCRCEVNQVNTYTNGTHTITGYSHYSNWEHHDIETTYSLLGETCMDGIWATESCTRCDYEHGYKQSTDYHWNVTKEVYDVSHLDMCTTEVRLQECVCGEETYLGFHDGRNNCWWNWVEGGPNYYIEQCPGCQTLRKTEYEDIEQIDPCHVKRHYTYTLTRDGKEPFVFEQDRVDAIHERVFTYTLLNPEQGCDGGYEIVATCFLCGDVDDNWGTGYGHEPRTVAMTKLTNGELCGELYRRDISCACGQETWSNAFWVGGSCTYGPEYWSEKDGAWVRACIVCSGECLGYGTEEKVEGATCEYKRIDHEIYRKNGVIIADNVREHTYTSHRNSIATPVLLNPEQGCDGGYTLNVNCPDCGGSWQEEEVRYGCEKYCVERTLLFENDAICGPVYHSVYRCACGKEIGLGRDEDCSFGWHWDDKLDAEVGECWDCGLKIATRYEFTPIEGETCKRTTNITYQFILGDNDPVVVEVSGVESSHETVTTFMDADEDPNNNLCETGYYVAFQCVNCDYYDSDTNWIRTGHERYPEEYHDLVKEFGACAGHIRKTSCACGENTTWDWDMNTFWEKAKYMGTDPETGLRIHQCPDCSLQYHSSDTEYVRDPETCTETQIERNRLVRDGETLLVFDRISTYEFHDWLGLSWSLKNPDGDCGDGFIWNVQCRDCGITGQHEGYGHADYATKVLDLPEDTCGGRIIEGRCACGWDTFVSHEYNCDENNFTTKDWYETIDGVDHFFWKYTCNKCKLTHVSDRYEEKIDDCHVYAQTTYTYSLGEEELGVFAQNKISETHDWNFSYTLMENSVTCDDGVYRSGSCKNCGQYTSDEIYSHEQGEIQRIDLSQYGAEGDTCLVERGCACGRYKNINTVGGETSCDLCSYHTEPWIEGYLDGVGPLYSTDGTGYWIYSYFYDVNCAVTDPQCSFRMRNAEYWLQEGCEAVEYEIWEVYDPETESFVTLSNQPTGDRRQNHNYTETITENVTEENGDYITYKRELVCPDCESTYILREGVRANGAQFTQWDIVNTLNNGDFKERHFINEYGVAFNGFQYETLEKDTTVFANGYEYWNQWEYTDYNFDGNCTRTEIYSNSNGNRDVREMKECHLHGGWEYEWVKYSTCSQFGLEIGTVSCTVCDTVFNYNEWIYEPRNHEDMYWDYDKQMYVCPHCGLEFSNYASGSIAMEDLTEDYGNGENYVIGYWNQNPDQEFNPTLTVILESVAEDQDDMLLLDFSDFIYLDTENGDDITAVTFNKEAADAAAAAVVENAEYTGTYFLRFNFVVVGGGQLDYAITFDPVTTN